VKQLSDRNNILGYFKTYISKMPLSLIKEVHISGITRLPNGVWADSHKEIGNLELNALKIILEQIQGMKDRGIPITLEYKNDYRLIPGQLEKIRDVYADLFNRA
jgi:uncharacterized protein (UPF0276 family)